MLMLFPGSPCPYSRESSTTSPSPWAWLPARTRHCLLHHFCWHGSDRNQWAAAHVLNLPPSGDKTLSPPLSAHPLSAPTLLSMGRLLRLSARETSGRPPPEGHIHPAGIAAPLGGASPQSSPQPSTHHSSLPSCQLGFPWRKLFIYSHPGCL